MALVAPVVLATTLTAPVAAQTVVRNGAVLNGASAGTSGSLRLTSVVGLAGVGVMTGGGLRLTSGAAGPAGGPTLTSLSPTSGLTAGGTRVRLRGSGFTAAATVTFGGTPAPTVAFVDATTLDAWTPARAAGPVDVVVQVGGESATLAGAYEYLVPPPNDTTDTDGDGMPDAWELRHGLDPRVPADAGLDPDGDGRTNREEYGDGTHPHGFFTRYLAEGASSAFFATRLAILNPTATPAGTLVRYLRSDGVVLSRFTVIAPRTRVSIDPEDTLGGGTAEFSTTVESDAEVIVDRTMGWDRGQLYGAHAETAVAAPATRWYLAEGATHGDFDLFYLLQNPGRTAADVRVTFLRASGPPIEGRYTVAPNSRFNIWVDVEQFPPGSGNFALATAEVSAVIDVLNGVPIIAERAMYLTRPGRLFAAGHNSAGVTAPALRWFFAEGATGPYFDLFILIANPDARAAQVRARYLLATGEVVTRDYTVAGNSRFNIWVDLEGGPLADAAVSTTLEVLNGVPVIAERAMWWPGGGATWHEAHNSPGVTATGTLWGLAEGQAGGPEGIATYVLIANTSDRAGTARVTLLFEDGTSVVRDFALAASSRFNVDVGHEFPEAAGRRFGTLVESVGSAPVQIVVERAMYADSLGVRWLLGTNAAGTRLR